MPKSTHKRAFKTMQVTTNNEIVSVTVNNETKFFDGLKGLVIKIAKRLKPVKKEKPKFANNTVAEAIQFIEYRTLFDRYRILNAVYTLNALKHSQELCTALGIVSRSYVSKRFGFDRSNLQLATRQHLIEDCREDNKIKIEITNADFDCRLVKFFGDLSPRAKDLISGTKVADKTFAYRKMTAEDKKAYRVLDATLAAKLNSELPRFGDDPDRLALKYNLLAHDKTLLRDLLTQVPDAVLKHEEIDEPIVVELQEQPIKVEKDVIDGEYIKKTVKQLNKMTIPKLKAFAKTNGFKLSGRTTQISATRAAIIRQVKEHAAQK